MEKWRIEVIERERGWGQWSWYAYFDTEAEALNRMNEINSQNKPGPAPDYYIQVDRKPVKVYVGKHMKGLA